MKPIIILNIILFLYQFEFIGDENLSVFRFFIFPLLIFACIKYKITVIKKDRIVLMICLLFFLFMCISSFLYNEFNIIISIIAQFVQLLFIYSYLQKYSFEKSTLWILVTYGLFHLFFFIAELSTFNIENRFKGYHWDPNYMCCYVLISLWAKVYLSRLYSKRKIIVLLYMLILSDIIMILFSLSKGGMLALLVTTLLYFAVYNRKRLFLFVTILSCFFTYGYIRSSFLSWSVDLGKVDMVIYRIFKQASDHGIDISSGRIDFIKNYFDMIISKKEGILFGMPISNFIINYNDDIYPHNSFLEILISGGLLCGGLFIVVILYRICKTVYFSFSLRKIPYSLMFAFSGFAVIFFLTFLGLKISWLFIGIIIALSNKEIFMKQISH